MYSTNNSNKEVLRELTNLAKSGYTVIPSTTLESYKDEETGETIILSDNQKRVYGSANAKVNNALAKLFNLTD